MAPMRTGYMAFLNFISMPTSVLPTTNFASGYDFFSCSRDSKLVGLQERVCVLDHRRSALQCSNTQLHCPHEQGKKTLSGVGP